MNDRLRSVVLAWALVACAALCACTSRVSLGADADGGLVGAPRDGGIGDADGGASRDGGPIAGADGGVLSDGGPTASLCETYWIAPPAEDSVSLPECAAGEPLSGTAIDAFIEPTTAAATAKPRGSVCLTVISGGGPGGAWCASQATIRADGSFTFRHVPAGPYFVEDEGRFFETGRRALDLGRDFLGRADVQPNEARRRASFTLRGLSPWESQDSLQLFTANAASSVDLDPRTIGADTLDVAPGASEGQGSIVPFATLDPLAGDRTLFVQLRAGAAPFAHRRAIAASAPVTVSAGASAPSVALEGLASSTTHVDAPMDGFRATRNQLASGATFWGRDLAVKAFPGGLSRGLLGIRRSADSAGDSVLGVPGLELLRVSDDASAALVGDVTLGAPPEAGSAFAVLHTLYVGAQLKSQVGHDGEVLLQGVRIERWQQATVVDSLASVQVTPILGPPRNLRIGGEDATAFNERVGTSPVLSWDAPDFGVPTHYVVRLVVMGEGTEWTMTAFQVTERALQVPPFFLRAGQRYRVVVESWQEGGLDKSLAIRRSALPLAAVPTLSGAFVP